MSVQRIAGRILGQRLSARQGAPLGLVIHITGDHSPEGPAENAFIYLDTHNGRESPRARYISWINLYDIEYADKRDMVRWQLVDRARYFRGNVQWLPYGWGDDPLPSVADCHHPRSGVRPRRGATPAHKPKP